MDLTTGKLCGGEKVLFSYVFTSLSNVVRKFITDLLCTNFLTKDWILGSINFTPALTPEYKSTHFGSSTYIRVRHIFLDFKVSRYTDSRGAPSTRGAQ